MKYTPTHYKVQSLRIDRNPLRATFVISLYNEDGDSLYNVTHTINLTQGEVDTLQAFVQDKMAAFETETGLIQF
jgi:hypothetical protein